MSMAQNVGKLVELLDLEEIDINLFRGISPPGGWGRVFGGQVVAQALVAAQRTVDNERACHSLHSYFLRGGDPATPILYEVVRSRDGRSFSSRRVIATQKGKEIFHMAASFQVGESGLEHQFTMPDVVPPDDLEDEAAIRGKIAEKVPEQFREHFLRHRPIDLRPINRRHLINPEPTTEMQYVWFRAKGKLPDDPKIHLCVLSYASDMSLLDTSLAPHGVNWMNSNIQMASLDHSLWFHHPFRADEWLLYAQESPAAAGGRGYNRGLIYTQDGRLVASAIQEGLMRVHAKKPV